MTGLEFVNEVIGYGVAKFFFKIENYEKLALSKRVSQGKPALEPLRDGNWRITHRLVDESGESEVECLRVYVDFERRKQGWEENFGGRTAQDVLEIIRKTCPDATLDGGDSINVPFEGFQTFERILAALEPVLLEQA